MVITNNKSQEKLESYRKDHRYLMERLTPLRGIEVNEKKYSLIKDHDIRDVFKYFFSDEENQKCEAYFEKFINRNLIKNDVIKVFLEDKNGIRKTEFNRVTKKFNGQKTYDISELYFCRESFLRAGWFIDLLINTGHLIGAHSERHSRILAKINEIKELQYFSEIIEGLIELKIIANGEEVCRPVEFGDALQAQKTEEKAKRTIGSKDSEVPLGIRSQIARENVNVRHEPVKKHLKEAIEPKMKILAKNKNKSFNNHAALAKDFEKNNESLLVVEYSPKSHYGAKTSKKITSAQLKSVAKKIAPEFGIHIAGTKKK